MNKKADKFPEAVKTLQHALEYKDKAAKDEIYYLAISKAYEVALEYSWKHLKREIERSGLEAFSPREVFKVAARMSLLSDLEQWLSFLDARNIAVHDYIGFDQATYLKKIAEFENCVKELTK